MPHKLRRQAPNKGGKLTNITLTMLDLAGTVALLLWGVHMVQTGIQRAFGAKLRSFLAKQLRNRLRAFFAGLGVTALLQSSTATGLMVTGFAAEGLVALEPGLAVMLGGNVGTTLIVQLLAFDVTLVAPILILAGYLLFRHAHAGVRDFGRVLIGLGLILLALHEFVTLFDPFTGNWLTSEFLSALSDHIMFIVLIGLVLTWAVHSSVATVLLAMSLATSHVLSLPAGIALALGANIGTAINPVTEGQARDSSARRLPVGNLLIRIVGALAVLAAYPWITPLVARIEYDPARAIANFHTGFNLVLALLMLPILSPYARLLERLIPARPIDDDTDAPRYLEPINEKMPVALTLGSASREALRLADILEQMIDELHDALTEPNRRRIEEAHRLDDRLDRLNRAIKENLIAIDSVRLDKAANEQLTRIFTFSTNIEQAGDLIDRGLLAVAGRRLRRGVSFSEEGGADLVAQVDRLRHTLRQSVSVFLSGNLAAARLLAAEKQVFRQIEEQATAAHLERLRSRNVEAIETSALHLDALRDLKQVGSHLIEASAYPILRQHGDLLPSRLRADTPDETHR